MAKNNELMRKWIDVGIFGEEAWWGLCLERVSENLNNTHDRGGTFWQFHAARSSALAGTAEDGN